MQAIERLEADGWAAKRQGVALTLRREGSDPRLLHGALSRLSPLLTDARLTGQWPGGHRLELEYVDDGFALTDASPGDLRYAFAATDLAAARNAWEGNIEAALSLTGPWRATAGIDPAQLLQRADETRRWYVLSDVEALLSLLNEQPWWKLGGLLEGPKSTVILINGAPLDLDLRTAKFSIRSLAADAQALANPSYKAEAPIVSYVSRAPGSIMAEMPIPSTLAPDPDRKPPPASCMAEVYTRLWSYCAATVWAWLASSVESEDPHSLTLEFFGLQRIRHVLQLDVPKISVDQCRASYRLWQWAAGSDTPDKLLAARQVISLYRDVPPWPQASDVQSVAESIFVALRSDATAEAFRLQRETRALSLEVARATASAAIDLGKDAIQRCMAALAAIGGIIVAQTTHVITDSQASKLRLLIGAFLIIMVGWSVFIDGPPATIAINSLPKDIGTLGELLSLGQREQVLNLDILKRARRHSIIVRVAVPVAYAIAAAAAFVLR